MKMILIKLFLYLGILLFVPFNSFAQQDREMTQKVYTNSEDILQANIKSHHPSTSIEAEKTIVKTEILNNGYLLVSQMGQFWNGTVWENSSLLSYTYTPEGLITEEINQFWNNGVWENSSRFLTTYYTNNLVSLYEQQNWNGSVWENSYKYSSIYNNENQIIEYNVEHWNGAAWENSYKTIYTYYASGNLESIVDQQWDGTSWLNSYKYSYQYNLNNNVSEKLTEEWFEGNWRNSIRDIYSYNLQDLVSLIASYWWSDTFWKESVEIYYEYDSIGNVTDKLTKFWESEILGLQNKYHTTYEYLPVTSLETKVENQEWDLQLMQWINIYRDIKIYNGHNLLQNHLMDVWDGSGWLSTNQENYSYDENLNLDTLLAQYWNGTEWINTFRAFHTWTLVTYIEEEDLSPIPNLYSLEQNYPNPFNPGTKIKFTLPVDAKVTIKVFDLLGEQVNILTDNNFSAGTHSIDFKADGLVSGLYIYLIDAVGSDKSEFHSIKKMMLIK